jgi:hypothetical protein
VELFVRWALNRAGFPGDTLQFSRRDSFQNVGPRIWFRPSDRSSPSNPV